MSDSQEPESVAQPADGTPPDAGATTAASEPLPIGGLLWIPALYLVLATLMLFGPVAKSMLSVTYVPGAAPVWGAPAKDLSVSPLVAAIEFVNFVVPLFLSIKFFQRRRYIPLLIIAWSVFGVVYGIGQGQALPPRALVLKVVSAALLVSYFSLSKRVKRTFLL